MRRVIALLLSIIFLISFGMVPAQAEQVSSCIEWLEDGSCIETVLYVMESRASGTKTARKVSTLKDGAGNVDVEMTLTATFTYDGTTAKATSAEVSVTIYDSAWSLISKYTVRSSNNATATVNLSRSALGVVMETPTITIKLTCDPDGNVS